MPCFFSAEEVASLNASKDDVNAKFNDLRNKLAGRNYKTKRAREYAFHGLIRRLDTMVRSINFVFHTLPPQQEDIPDSDDTIAAAIIIQSFIINTQGCLDNLAWIWVFETKQRDRFGRPLDRKAVGLTQLRRTFSKSFQKYLKRRKKWFRHVSEFRDSLAHRIPLYVPPFILSDHNSEEYHRLEKEAFEAGLAGDYEAYNKLKSKQKGLGAYRPWMTHSSTEKSPAAVFHPQMLQDFLTIDECTSKVLEEIKLFEKNSSERRNLYAVALRWWQLIFRT